MNVQSEFPSSEPQHSWCIYCGRLTTKLGTQNVITVESHIYTTTPIVHAVLGIYTFILVLIKHVPNTHSECTMLMFSCNAVFMIHLLWEAYACKPALIVNVLYKIQNIQPVLMLHVF